ncbi:polyketide synthase [Colletotrichum acutatum]
MQQDPYHDLLAQTGIAAAQLGYVGMHGTASQAGDAANMSIVAAGFGSARSPGYLTHCTWALSRPTPATRGAAVAMASLIKSTMILKHRLIPVQTVPSSGRLELIRHLPPIHDLGIHGAGKSHVFRAARVGYDHKIMINNSDIAGVKVSLLLEEGSNLQQQQYEHGGDGRKYRVVVVSEHIPQVLRHERAGVPEHLRAHPQTSLVNVAYTATARRVQHACRTAYLSDSIKNLVPQLECNDNDDIPPVARSDAGADEHGSVVFVFPARI